VNGGEVEAGLRGISNHAVQKHVYAFVVAVMGVFEARVAGVRIAHAERPLPLRHQVSSAHQLGSEVVTKATGVKDTKRSKRVSRLAKARMYAQIVYLHI
jgi:hypothetical protein